MGGGVGDTLTAQMQRDGIIAPTAVSYQPTLPLGLLTFLEAFHDLDSERSHGFALVRIPWSRIVAYGLHYGYDIEELVFFIREMDDAHLQRLSKETAGGGSGGTEQTVSRAPRPDN